MSKKEKTVEKIVVQKDKEGKEKALAAALKTIEKTYGKGAIMRLGDSVVSDVEVISTSSLSLDLALGIGGIPKGRITEIYGPESSGKTTLALHVVAESQKNGGIAAFIDAEHALDPEYAKKIGVNINDLYVSQPDTGEQALEILESLVRSGAVDLIVVDSVAALVPKAEIDGEMGNSVVGLHARLMSQAMRKLAGVINKANTAVIFINQLREKVGIVYGNPEVTTGGRALKFYSSVRMEVRKLGPIKEGSDFIGNRTKVKVVKNKMAPPFKIAEFDIFFGQGISKMGDIMDIAIELDLIHKAGSWFSYNDQRIGQGREKVKDFLEENVDIRKEIEEKIIDHVRKLGRSQSSDESEVARSDEDFVEVFEEPFDMGNFED